MALYQDPHTGETTMVSVTGGTGMDPATAMLIVGGVNALLSIWGGFGEGEIAEMNDETKLKIAADMIGVKYAELAETRRQFDTEMKNNAYEFAKQFNLDVDAARQRKDEFKKKYGLERMTAEAQTTFGAVDRMTKLRQEREGKQRRSGIRQVAKAVPKGRPTMAVTPTATRTAGSQVLAGTGQPATAFGPIAFSQEGV